MAEILTAGKLVVQRIISPDVQQTVLLYRPHAQDPYYYRELLVLHNGRVEERFGERLYDPLKEMSRNGSSVIFVKWCEATDDDLEVLKTMWGDSQAHLAWLARMHEREGRLDRSELERLERVFGCSREPVA